MPCPMHVLHELPVCILASPISPSNPSTQSINFQMLEYHFQPRGSTLRSTPEAVPIPSLSHHQFCIKGIPQILLRIPRNSFRSAHVSPTYPHNKRISAHTFHAPTPHPLPHHPVPFSPTPFALGFQPSPLPAPSSSRPPSIKTTLRPQIHDEKVTATLLQLRDSWNTRSGRNPLSLSLSTPSSSQFHQPFPPPMPHHRSHTDLINPNSKSNSTLPYPTLPCPFPPHTRFKFTTKCSSGSPMSPP